MNKTTAFFLIVIASLTFTLGATIQSKAQQKSFAGVIPFVTNNDRISFFDQSSGKIYVYDNNVSQCLFVGQVQDLGKPVQMIATGNLTSNPSNL